jgi:hypothetical protein
MLKTRRAKGFLRQMKDMSSTNSEKLIYENYF